MRLFKTILIHLSLNTVCRIEINGSSLWTILGEYKFPYVAKRVRVVRRIVTELSPIDVALDEMRMRVSELEDVVVSSPTDAKKLQLRLQGSVCVQVNAGPLAYAYAFLDPARPGIYSDVQVAALKDVFL